jgi:hypothetical protein
LADGPDPDLAPVDLRVHGGLAHLPLDQGQERLELLRRARQVLRGQDPDGDHRDPQLLAPLQHLLQLGRPALVPQDDVGQPELAGKAAIPVQDQADMAGGRLPPDLGLEPPLV